MSNFTHISANHYKVLNQNGFNNALYHYFSDEPHFTKKRIREMVENYPTVYPCEIYIIDLTFECSRIFVESPDGQVNMECPW